MFTLQLVDIDLLPICAQDSRRKAARARMLLNTNQHNFDDLRAQPATALRDMQPSTHHVDNAQPLKTKQ